jgi:hypothetical protein
VKPTWCSFYSISWELRTSTCFEHYLLILRRWCIVNKTLSWITLSDKRNPASILRTVVRILMKYTSPHFHPTWIEKLWITLCRSSISLSLSPSVVTSCRCSTCHHIQLWLKVALSLRQPKILYNTVQQIHLQFLTIRYCRLSNLKTTEQFNFHIGIKTHKIMNCVKTPLYWICNL